MDTIFNRHRLMGPQDDDVITVSSDDSESPVLFAPPTPNFSFDSMSDTRYPQYMGSESVSNLLQELTSHTNLREPVIVPNASASNAKVEHSTSSTSEQNNEELQAKKKSVEIDENEIDDGDNCPICFESWNNAGPHRLCALHCGHVFGYSCITRWMDTSKNSCPTCKNKINKHDIRFIYAKKLIAVDTMELETVKQQLQESQSENVDLKMQVFNYRLKENQWLSKQRELELKIENLEGSFHSRHRPIIESPVLPLDYSLIAPPPFQPRRFNLYKDKSIEITKDGGCRSIAYNPRLNLMVASAKRTDNLFPGYGVSFLDVTTYRLFAYQRLHGQEIRDLRYHPNSHTLATVSIDKTFKLLDCSRSNGAVSTFTADCPLWSCCWDLSNPYIAYIGSQQGMVTQLDQRNLAQPVSVFSVSDDYGAIVQMHSLPPSHQVTAGRYGGLVICKLQSCWFFENADAGFRKHKLMGSGPYFSMCVEPITRLIFISSRGRVTDDPQDQYIKHTLFNLESIDNAVVSNVVHTYHGGFAQTKISRPCFSNVFDNEEMFISAYHENDRKVYMWSINTGRTIGFVPAQDNVMGIVGMTTPFKALVTLTDKRMEFHKVAL